MRNLRNVFCRGFEATLQGMIGDIASNLKDIAEKLNEEMKFFKS